MDNGTQIGPYRIESPLGRGGMAEVYRALHIGLQRHEALKVLAPALSADANFSARFLREARTAASLQHPNIAAIHALSEPNSPRPYFTMELVEGGDLGDLLQARGRLSLPEARPLLEQIASALDYAHSRGVVHRDIKPANILLTDRARPSIKLVDFGIARAREDEGAARLTQAGMIVGTPEYMSPEQATGAPVDGRTDVYALGIVAYELLCGQPPFRAAQDTSAISILMQHVQNVPRPPLEHTPNLPPSANAAILRALAKDREQRFSSCGEFVHALFSPAPAFGPFAPPANQNQPAPTMPAQARPPQSGPMYGGPMQGPPMPRPPMPQGPSAQAYMTPRKPAPVVPILIGVALVGGLGLTGLGLMGGSETSSPTSTPRAASTGAAPTAPPLPSPSPQVEWKTFSDAQSGWSINFPASWKQKKESLDKGNSALMTFTPPSPQVSLVVRVDRVAATVPAMEDVQYQEKLFQKDASAHYKKRSMEPATLGGHKGVRWEYDLGSGGTTVRTVRAEVPMKQKRLYYIVYTTAPAATFESWQAVFEEAISSFRVPNE